MRCLAGLAGCGSTASVNLRAGPEPPFGMAPARPESFRTVAHAVWTGWEKLEDHAITASRTLSGRGWAEPVFLSSRQLVRSCFGSIRPTPKTRPAKRRQKVWKGGWDGGPGEGKGENFYKSPRPPEAFLAFQPLGLYRVGMASPSRRRPRKRVLAPAPESSARIYVRVSSADIALFRFLLEAHDNLGVFTVVNKFEGVLMVRFFRRSSGGRWRAFCVRRARRWRSRYCPDPNQSLRPMRPRWPMVLMKAVTLSSASRGWT